MAFLLVLPALGGCETPHALLECGATIPCPDGMACSADGLCILVNPYDGSIDARPILRDGAPPPDATPPPDAGADAAKSECGDGWCQFGFEDCTTCEFDCDTCPGTCGDDRCDDIERCWICPEDCGECTGCDHTTCEVGPPLLETCPDPCITQVCALKPECCTTAWDDACVRTADVACLADCFEPVCGDLICDRDDLENCVNCPSDCECLGCDHVVCEIGTPLPIDCAPCVTTVCEDIPHCCITTWDRPCINRMTETCFGVCVGTCGDGLCAPTEFCEPVIPGAGTPCNVDCGCDVCGDGVCRPAFGESCASCPLDCGACPDPCGDGSCDVFGGESCASCAADCGVCPPCEHDVCIDGAPLTNDCSACVTTVCTADAFCCAVAWDDRCVDEAQDLCGVVCPGSCGDGTCGPGENCTNCAADCGPCPPSCGDGVCTGTEVCFTCPADCGPCLPACGDGVCVFTQGEFCLTCPADCGPCP